jgi:hypothetical protein
VYRYHIFLIHSSVLGHLGCFHNLAIVNSASCSTLYFQSVFTSMLSLILSQHSRKEEITRGKSMCPSYLLGKWNPSVYLSWVRNKTPTPVLHLWDWEALCIDWKSQLSALAWVLLSLPTASHPCFSPACNGHSPLHNGKVGISFSLFTFLNITFSERSLTTLSKNWASTMHPLL